jgi:hypothetical protein
MSYGFHGVKIADISDLRKPVEISTMELGGFSLRINHYVFEKMKFLIVTHELRISIVNVTNPYVPNLMF